MNFVAPSPFVAGYADPDYARSLREFGTPLFLPRSRTWLLKRAIGGSGLSDAMGPYPLLLCEDWSTLGSDLGELAGELVSVVAVADPFGTYEMTDLRAAFPDLVRPYKEHFLVDLSSHRAVHVGEKHCRNVCRALEQVAVEQCSRPGEWLEDWLRLYENLVVRHGISGIAAFSRAAFQSQFEIPGVVLFRAFAAGKTVGMLMWYWQGTDAYYHLGAYSSDGYRAGASFALFHYAIEWFENAGCRRLLLGGGRSTDASDGLARFKRAWATDTIMSYLCGRILDRESYQRLSSTSGRTEFFPAYRTAEQATAVD